MTMDELADKIDRLKYTYMRLSRLGEERELVKEAIDRVRNRKYDCVASTLSGGHMGNGVSVPMPGDVFVEHAESHLVALEREIGELLRSAAEM